MASIRATEGSGSSWLVSRQSYTNFEIRVEFWASDDANSGIYLRCQNPERLRIATAMRPIFSISDLKPLTAQEASFMWRQFLSLYLKRAIAGTSIE